MGHGDGGVLGSRLTGLNFLADVCDTYTLKHTGRRLGDTKPVVAQDSDLCTSEFGRLELERHRGILEF